MQAINQSRVIVERIFQRRLHPLPGFHQFTGLLAGDAHSSIDPSIAAVRTVEPARRVFSSVQTGCAGGVVLMTFVPVLNNTTGKDHIQRESCVPKCSLSMTLRVSLQYQQ